MCPIWFISVVTPNVRVCKCLAISAWVSSTAAENLLLNGHCLHLRYIRLGIFVYIYDFNIYDFENVYIFNFEYLYIYDFKYIDIYDFEYVVIFDFEYVDIFDFEYLDIYGLNK